MSTTMTSTQTITAQNILTLFPEVDTSIAAHSFDSTSNPSAASRNNQHDDLSGYDEEQIRLMDEVCIVLDENDTPIGSASKKTCHLMTNIDMGLLHRAFSVFLFDPATHKLLLQQRASEKITFPDMWTNTCCSHPLAHPSESGTGDLPSSVTGVKRAAQRKLEHELGIKPESVPLSKFDFLTRIHYLAPSESPDTKPVDAAIPTGREPTTSTPAKWGEHEIDYILFIEADVELDVNKNEVRDTRYVSPEELKQMFAEDVKGRSFTPWFKLICNSMLFKWWEGVGKEGGLDSMKGEQGIRRML